MLYKFCRVVLSVNVTTLCIRCPNSYYGYLAEGAIFCSLPGETLYSMLNYGKTKVLFDYACGTGMHFFFFMPTGLTMSKLSQNHYKKYSISVVEINKNIGNLCLCCYTNY